MKALETPGEGYEGGGVGTKGIYFSSADGHLTPPLNNKLARTGVVKRKKIGGGNGGGDRVNKVRYQMRKLG